ncbi:putative DNA-binding bromodomain-containing protein [Melia azedarach]|uniref:DNA-binding bromodomain-containing protein n=1 Tax=Melia azedarach TaxID=155640 RepID=A0ACC1X295_MELAZ|nr:putative DNA-binding bromodomain-containing protein [Melia azedarach]
MDKPSNNFLEKQTAWGTWEELLLACAVHRYGAENWSSVATEVQKRSSRLQLLTPRSCQQKYRDLERRFARNGAASLADNESIPWLNELKKLRVAELKRELQRYDLSIVSLQLKVKRLTEERERNEEEKETKKGDQMITGEEEREVIDNKPESLTGKPESGEESDRENRSVNESNSTDPKVEDTEKETEPAEPVPDKHVGEDAKPAGEDSCNGSCGSAAKKSAAKSERVDSLEAGESVAESEDSGEVESAVSLSRKEEEKNDKPEKSENEEDQFPAAAKQVSVESQTLIDCLEIIRSHKFGSLFERLDTKETSNYRNLIRQLIDLETIRTRLEENWYSGCKSSFFRDLLLLFNNAILLFNKESSESAAAMELRQIVLKEMSRQTSHSHPNSSQKEQSLASLLPPVQAVKLECSDTLLSKPNILAPIIACRKRSSITTKRSVPSSLADKKGEPREQPVASAGKNSLPDSKLDKSSSRITEKRMRERIASGAKNGKTRGNVKTKKNLEVETKAEDYSSEEEEEIHSEDSEEGKTEKGRKNKAKVNGKKRSAAEFLSRMKRSSSDKGLLLETAKSEKAEQKKRNESGKVDAKKEQITKKRSGGKGGKEKQSPAKRNAGGPVTRAAASPTPVTVVRGRRRRGSVVETEGSGSGRGRKRSRK